MRTHTLFGAFTASLVLILAACGDQPVAPPESLAPEALQSVIENGWQDFEQPMFTCFEPVHIQGQTHTVLTFQENANRVSFSWHVRLIGTGTGEFSGGLYHLNESFSGSQSLGTDPEYPHVININDRMKLIGQGLLPDLHGHTRFHLTINANGEGAVQFVDASFECGQTKGKGRTLVVNVVDDDDDGKCGPRHCSLREAILAANLFPGRNTIAFDIPGPGPHTIHPTHPLPWVTSPAILDATTEPDFAGTPVVELEGAPHFGAGLSIVGGNTTVTGFAIHGFHQGVWLAWNGGNKVVGNHIGTDVTGTAAPGNHGEGIFVDESPGNIIGGTSPDEGNVISGNRGNGVMLLGGGSNSNWVQGNVIGADISGTVALPNGTGIFMMASGNLIGGWDPGAGNLVSGNSDFGIHLIHSPGNTIQGNLVGTDMTGAAPLGNGFAGIQLEESPDNVIGGTVPGARNVVSANGFGHPHHLFDGIALGGFETHSTVVQGNYIGTDLTGTVDLGNANAGVMLAGSHDNTVGGATPGAGNLLSGNIEGVTLVDTWGNLVQGNLIGTDVNGAASIANNVGVLILSHDNLIGGTDPAARNVISGNLYDGIRMEVDAGNNRVLGNLIGTDVTGTLAVPNETGIAMLSHGNVVGGGDPAARNVISGNTGDGLRLEQGAGGNQISGNFFGTDINGTAALGNGGRGVNLNDAHGNTVGGGPGEGNVLSANHGGVALVFNSSGNAVVGNLIGTDVHGTSPLGNVRSGVLIGREAGGNGIGGRDEDAGNVIAFNEAGIRIVNSGGSGNGIEWNSIFDNTALGIDIGGAGVTLNDPGDVDGGSNDSQNFPVLDMATPSGIMGTLNSTPDTEFYVEFFVNDVCDPSGYGEGKTFLGATSFLTDAAGDVGFTVPFVAPPGSFVTATATDPNGSTSEFSACVQAT